MGAHGGQKRLAAGGQRDQLAQDGCNRAFRQALEQAYTFTQGRFERELPAHGPFGDGGDMRLDAQQVCQFIDAFLRNHGGVHIGQEQLLASVRGGDDGNVYRQRIERMADPFCQRLEVFLPR